MNKDIISDKQGVAIIVLFILGTNTMMAAGLSAEKDSWLAVICGIIMAFPLILIFARLNSLFFNKDIFDVIEICIGQFLGKGIIIFLTLYEFLEISVVLRNFSQFPITVSLINTPQIIIAIIFMVLCAWVVKEGIQVIGKWASIFLITFIIIPIISILLMINIMNIDNILPMLEYGIKPVLKGGYEVLMFPFSQMVVLLMVFTNFNRKNSSYNIYLNGFFLGGLLLFVLSLVAILVLGEDSATSLYYPAYGKFFRISIGRVFQRTEIIQGVLLTFGAFIKVSILLLATCKGVSRIFELDDYRVLVIPITLLSIILSQIQFRSVMEYYEWNDEVWYYYSFPIQVLLPIIIWVIAEFKRKRI